MVKKGMCVAAAILAMAAAAGVTDKYIWLEDVSSERSMAWVKAHNDATSKVLEADPRFAQFQAEALHVLESPDRLPMPDLIGDQVYNTWQDAAHVNGILRRTSLNDYLTAQPHWETLIDFDELGHKDGVKWVSKGRECLSPAGDLCMVALSAGGEDASTMREFDMKSGRFVPGGFELPKSKQGVAWRDKDHLLVGRDWGSGTMTKSGYPFVIKSWKRGETLDKAAEIFRGRESDTRADAIVLNDSDGHTATLIDRSVTFFESEIYLLLKNAPHKVSLPMKIEIDCLARGQLVFTINQDWTPEGSAAKFVSGSVLSEDLAAMEKDPVHLKPRVLFEPTATEFAESVDRTRDFVILTTLNNVQGRAYRCALLADGSWEKTTIAVPEKQTVSLVSTNPNGDQYFLSVASFLTPSTLMIGDARKGTFEKAKSRPAQFDASNDVVEQLSARSKDGTSVPYFIVHRKGLANDGSTPTLMTAYGGFQISSTPRYSPVLGKLWLERGGSFVLANIRGGGEFGPAWHEAGLKTHRQRIYDDFAAVARDLDERKITSPRRLGIEGGSNGGLLMGVEMTQHPEMWNAVLIEVPLLDMLRFEQIGAGASWVDEYGSVSVPEERAFLASISPYHQLKENVKYPEPFIFTTTKDDRVGPVHARKFAAKMEEFHKPFFYQEIVEGGHGTGADLKEQARTEALSYTYLARKLVD